MSIKKYLVTYDNAKKQRNGDDYKGDLTGMTIRQYLESLAGVKVAETSYIVHSGHSMDELYKFIFDEYKFDLDNKDHYLAVAEVNYVKYMKKDSAPIDPLETAKKYIAKKARGE